MTDTQPDISAARAPLAVVTALRDTVQAMLRDARTDLSGLVAICLNHAVSAETVLDLQHATLDAARTAARPGFVTRMLHGTPEPPAAFVAALRTATAAVLRAILAPVPPEKPPAEAAPVDPTDDNAGLMRQSTWLIQATNRTAAAAGRVSDRCGVVLEAAAMAFIGINTTADASEQVATATEALSRDLGRTEQASLAASAAAEQASSVIQELEAAAASIGSVTDIIRGIAARTNMLALNATIEAARAGEAGRGFAVVAKEVKALAQQTAAATGKIGQSIEQIRAAVTGAARQVAAIQQSTSDLREMATTGAESVARQRISVNEINQAAQDASTAVKQMHEGIEEVATQSFELSTATEELLAGAEVLHARASGPRTAA